MLIGIQEQGRAGGRLISLMMMIRIRQIGREISLALTQRRFGQGQLKTIENFSF